MLKKLLDLILYSSVFTACCATGLCCATELLINHETPYLFNRLHILVFGSALLVYNVHHAAKKKTIVYGLASVTPRAKELYTLFTVVGLGMTIYGLWGISQGMLAACLVLGVLSFAYSFPILPIRHGRKLREIGWLKIIDLAGVWTIVTSVLPMVYWQKHLTDYPFEILLRFTFIFTLCIIFDLRDMQTDAVNHINTLPNKIGANRSYRLIDVTLMLFVLLSVLQYMHFPIWQRLAGAIFTAITTRMVGAYLMRYPSDRGYMLLADGVMLVYAFSVLLF